MPRGEEVEEMKHPARPGLRGIHVVGDGTAEIRDTIDKSQPYAITLKQTAQIFAPTVLCSRVKSEKNRAQCSRYLEGSLSINMPF